MIAMRLLAPPRVATVPVSAPVRQDYIRATAAVAEARQQVEEIGKRDARLRTVAEAAAPIEDELQRAIAADGGAELQALTAGDAHTGTAALIMKGAAAATAAAAARRALPLVESELNAARTELATRQQECDQALARVLIAAGDAGLGAAYHAKFRELATLNDELHAFASAVAAIGGVNANIVVSDNPFEVPRFNLPSMRAKSLASHGDFHPYLRHSRDVNAFHAGRLAWLDLAERLKDDPAMEIAMPATGAAIAKRNSGLAARMGDAIRSIGPLLTRTRIRPDEDPQAQAGALLGFDPAAPRPPRTMRMIGGEP